MIGVTALGSVKIADRHGKLATSFAAIQDPCAADKFDISYTSMAAPTPAVAPPGCVCHGLAV
jgi:hypothetical protein